MAHREACRTTRCTGLTVRGAGGAPSNQVSHFPGVACLYGRVTDPVCDRFVQRARELDDCASFVAESDGTAETLRLEPHDTHALGVSLRRAVDGYTFELRFAQPSSVPLEHPTSADDVDLMVDLAVEGRVRMYLLRGKAAVTEVLQGDRYVRGGQYGRALRLPGWRRRAHLTTFVPYRSRG